MAKIESRIVIYDIRISSQVVPWIWLGYGWMNICVRRRGRRGNVLVQGVCEWVLGRRSVCRWREDEQVVVVVR